MNDVISIALASTDDKYINGLLPSLKSAFGDKVLFVPGNESLKKSKSELNFNLINFWSEFDAVFYVGNKKINPTLSSIIGSVILISDLLTLKTQLTISTGKQIVF